MRKPLLAGLAAGILCSTAPAIAQSVPDCGNATGTSSFEPLSQTLTCSGDQSPGLSTGALNLTVKNLSSDITPVAGRPGIEVFGSFPILLESDLRDHRIVTTGAFAHGIDASREGGLSIMHTGDILALGFASRGISAKSLSGEITVSSSGSIVVGHSSAGIFAEAPGGAVSIDSQSNITGGPAGSGIYAAGSGRVSVRSSGNIRLTGEGEPLLGFNGGIVAISQSDIEIISTSDISTTEDLRSGILAISDLGGSSIVSEGNIAAAGFDASGVEVLGGLQNEVDIVSGTVTGGDGFAASVTFSSGAGSSNTLNNHGALIAGASGYAVAATGESRTIVNNYATVAGSIDLTRGGSVPISGASAFNNMGGAILSSGNEIELGPGGVLNNRGTLSPGGTGVAATTVIGGHLIQTQTGRLAVDIDPGNGSSDAITVRGRAALSGTVLPQLLSLNFLSLESAFTILSATHVTNNGLSVSDTALIDYSLLYPTARDVVLSARLKFTATGLSPNQSSVFEFFRVGADAGLFSRFETVYLGFINAPDLASIAAIADQLTTHAAGGAASNGMQFGDALATALRSCPVAEGSYGQLRETSCVWAKPTYRQFSQDKGSIQARIVDDTSGISGGFQTALGENFWGGLGFSLEESNTDIDGSTRVDGTWWQVGGVAKWAQGPWKLSGSLSGGEGNLETVRAINIPGFATIASSSTDTGFATGLARLAYSFGETGFYVTPMLNIGFNYVRVDGFTESGADVLNLQVFSANETIFSGGPAVEIGATIMAQGLTFRPYAKFGVTFLSEDAFATQARFAAAPASIAPFTITSRFDDVFAGVSAGVQWFSASGINLRLNYDGRFGDSSEQHGVDAKLTFNY